MSESEEKSESKEKVVLIKKDNKFYKLTDYVNLYISDALNHDIKKEFTMIYFDPPFNSDRDYKLSTDSDLGFSDKWTDSDYEVFITKIIDKLHDLLKNNGTLYFHISSSCMFIPEKILRGKHVPRSTTNVGRISQGHQPTLLKL